MIPLNQSFEHKRLLNLPLDIESVLDSITLLAPYTPGLTISRFLADLSAPTQFPFSKDCCENLNHLSQNILRDSTLRADAASVALAYWLRLANIKKIQSEFERRSQKSENIIYVPAGLVLQMAPSNIDTLFAFSWALSYLCGNSNIVRISLQQNQIVFRLVDKINVLMAKDAYLAQHNCFITYPHADSITGMLSSFCNHRVIWGGDKTVAALRAVPLSTHASERVFATKFSYAVIAATSFNQMSDEEQAKFAARFYNDVFRFDQMACSSPHIIFWLGEPNEVVAAVTKANTVLSAEVIKRGYSVSPAQALHRMKFAFEAAAQHEVHVDWSQSGFISMKLLERAALTKDICGGGLLKHVQVDNIAQVAQFAEYSDQTIVHWGLSTSEVRQLAESTGMKGIDRVVPVGEALDFGPIWDGYDLINDFLRQVVVRG